jgi:16S rRNA (guanine1207-N2)-methyltransferase
MREALAPREPVGTEEGFFTAEGGFSADGVDSGSLLLAENLPEGLTGEVADFASGWGYLAAWALRRSPGIERMDLYEAHLPSLLAAKRNLPSVSDSVECRFFWHDLLREPVTARYDAILMNPPFHQGRAAEPDLGVEMIGTAAKALKRGGRLFMVANRPLPYERVLEKLLPRYEEICRHARFKVLVGRK